MQTVIEDAIPPRYAPKYPAHFNFEEMVESLLGAPEDFVYGISHTLSLIAHAHNEGTEYRDFIIILAEAVDKWEEMQWKGSKEIAIPNPEPTIN